MKTQLHKLVRTLHIVLYLTPIFFSSISQAMEIGVGGSLGNFNYVEQFNVDSENGSLPSWIGDIKFEVIPSTNIELYYSTGSFKSTYKGSTLNTQIPVIATTPMTVIDYSAMVKQNLFGSFSLFAGVGYHYWDRQVGGSPGSPDEQYSWSYTPFGFEFAFAGEANQEIRMHFEFQPMSSAKMKGTFQGYSPVEVNLGAETNFLFKMPIRWNPGATFMVETTPWYQYSSIGQSNTISVSTQISSTGYLVEPSSTNNQYGLEVLFIYKM
jgi:hypothetical protein